MQDSRTSLVFKILILAGVTVSLFGRDNPFTPPSLKNETLSNIPRADEKMGVEKLTIPSDAVKLRRVIVEYYRLDGATDRRTFEIDKTLEHGKALWLHQNGEKQ